MGFLNDLKKLANNETAKAVISDSLKELFNRDDSQGVSNTVPKEELNVSNIETKEEQKLFVSNLPIDWQTGLTNEVKEVDYIYTKICHRLKKPTNFYITDDDFGAAEVANAYIYSENGEVVEDYMDCHKEFAAEIVFGEPSYHMNSNEIRRRIKNWYNIDNVTIESRNEGSLKYRIYGESNDIYYDAYLYKSFRLDNCYVKICLVMHKNQLTADKIQEVLNEFYSIIHTVEIKEIPGD